MENKKERERRDQTGKWNDDCINGSGKEIHIP